MIIPWSVAMASRSFIRLRDEKVALVEETDELFYCLFFQATDDETPIKIISPNSIILNKNPYSVPGWIIPKPPPRKKNEILHPAKFPEMVVFVKLAVAD